MMYSSEQIKMSNWTKSYSYKLTAEQIQAVEKNECWNFKTTSEGKETMKQIWKETPFGVEGGFGRLYAEAYDEASWFRARCAYLEHKNYELEEQMKFLDTDGKPCDRCNEPVCYEGNEGRISNRDEAIICSECFAREEDEDRYDECEESEDEEEECRQLMCQSCIDKWEEYEMKGTPIAGRWRKEENEEEEEFECMRCGKSVTEFYTPDEEDEEEFECGGCGKSFHYKSKEIEVEEFYSPDGDYRVGVTCSDCQGKYCRKCDVSMENEGGCDCQIIKCGECGLEGPKYNHNRGEDGVLRCDDCHSD